MANLPSKCTICGHVFASSAISIEGNVADIIVSNNSVRCPRCGGRALGIEGQFAVQDDSYVPIAAGESSLEILRRLYGRAKETGDSPDEREALIREVEAFSPALASAIAPYARKAPIPFLLLVLFLVLVKCNFNINIDFDVNEAIAEATRQAEQGDIEELSAEVIKTVDAKLTVAQEIEKPTKRKLRRQRGQTKMTQGKPLPKS